MPYKKVIIPEKIKAFVELGFDYSETRVSGSNAYGECILCGKKDKFYINVDNGLWDCKSCGERGNISTYMNKWYEIQKQDQEEYDLEFSKLAADRSLPKKVLIDSGIIFDGEKFYIPCRNTNGSIVNLYSYNLFGRLLPSEKKHACRGLVTIPAALYGLEYLTQKNTKEHRIFIVEGIWDTIALRYMLQKEMENGIPLGSPGKDAWKNEWTEYIVGRKIICGYDKGVASEKASGINRLHKQLETRVKSFDYIAWPEPLPNGYDIRDFYISKGKLADLFSLIKKYVSIEVREDRKLAEAGPTMSVSNEMRPTFEEVLKVYSKHFIMTSDMVDMLKVSFATVLTTQISGPALWLWLVGPASSGKTTVAMSTSGVSYAIARSSLSANSLMSGFAGPRDPSLLAILDGKFLIIKDATEILTQAKDDKAKIFSTLRGAYDQSCTYTYGNGVVRDYKAHFNAIFAVTAAIYTEQSASLGSRFLMLHTNKGVQFNNKEITRSAIRSVGRNQFEIAEQEVREAATNFLDVIVNEDDIPAIDERIEDILIALADLCAVLRAAVERDYRDRKLLYRPQPEMSTRIAKQLTKLLIGLALIHKPAEVTESDLRIVARVAMDSCIGFNVEAMACLMEKPRQTIQQISEMCKLNTNIIRDQLDDLVELGAVFKEVGKPTGGRAPFIYSCSERLFQMWKASGISRNRVTGEITMINYGRIMINRKGRKQIY